MDLALRQKRALITGGTHGIGAATAHSLAREGCHIAICARATDRITQVLDNLRGFAVETIGISADVLSASDIDRVAADVESRWGGIDILINNVGGGGRWGSEIYEDVGDEVWLDVFNKNAMAAVRFTRWAVPGMLKRQWGRVVTVASIYGREGGGRPWFNMAKSAEISLMKCLSMSPRLARSGITFNSVAPGAIMIPDTGWDRMRTNDPAAFEQMLNASFPMGRLGTAEEVASVVTFLCSSAAAYVNGACVVVDGGESRSF